MVKKYLSEYERSKVEFMRRNMTLIFPLNHEIRVKTEYLKMLSEQRYDFDRHLNQRGVKSNCHKGTFAETIADYVQFEGVVASDIARLLYMASEINRTIELLPISDGRTVLSLRYQSLKKFPEIANIMFYDIRWIRRLHDSALLDIHNLIYEQSKVLPKVMS